MEAVNVVFDEILHVHRNRASRTAPEHTIFSFMSNFKYTPYVTVPGSPRLEPGMRVKALLRTPGDWKSLIGWIDLKTGEITAPNPNWHLRGLLLLGLWLAGISLVLSKALVARHVPLLLFWVLAVGVGAFFGRVEYKAWRRAQFEVGALRALAAENEA